MNECHFCTSEARAWYRRLPFCQWHLILFYLGLDYVGMRVVDYIGGSVRVR